jgi:hypothetical protein
MVFYQDAEPYDGGTWEISGNLLVRYPKAGGGFQNVTVTVASIKVDDKKDKIVDYQVVVTGSAGTYTAVGKIAYWDGVNSIFAWK